MTTTIDNVHAAFIARVGAAPALPFVEALRAVVDFYVAERVIGCVLDDDGDMLLAQWGPRRIGGTTTYVLDLCRQLIINEQDAEPVQQHLHCTLPADTAVPADSLWCDTPAGVDAFVAALLGSPVAAVAGAASVAWSIELEAI